MRTALVSVSFDIELQSDKDLNDFEMAKKAQEELQNKKLSEFDVTYDAESMDFEGVENDN